MRNFAVLFILLAASAFAQQQFSTPEAAAQALITAAAAGDTAALDAIFGPHGKTLLTSGNPMQDASDRQEFVTLSRDGHQLKPDSMNPNRMLLSVGNQDWPFPVPIVKRDGKWMFDSDLGTTVLKARRVGADEMDVIAICSGFVTAQQDYAEQHPAHNYAAHIAELKGFLPAGMIAASGEHPAHSYHGYYFRTLTAQGAAAPGGPQPYLVRGKLVAGFALLAWPAEYGVTGIETFIVNQDGYVYEKDFGEAGPSLPPVTIYNPDSTWIPVQ